MKKILFIVFSILLFINCRPTPEMHVYKAKLFQINIPHGWIVKEGEFQFMPISVRKNENSEAVVPNFNITLIEPKNESLKAIVDQNSRNNCPKGNCENSKVEQIKIGAEECYKSYQELLIGRNRIVILQYYSEKANTVYLLSFFCLKKDFLNNGELFNKIAQSFELK